MKNSYSPNTNTISYFDSLSNEWVTTITIRHKVDSTEASKADPLKCLKVPSAISGLNKLPSDLKLPTLNQKDLGIYPY